MRDSELSFDDEGRLLSSPTSLGVRWSAVPNRQDLLAEALSGRRIVQSLDDGRRVTVGLPLRSGPGAALVEVAALPDLLHDGVGLRRVPLGVSGGPAAGVHMILGALDIVAVAVIVGVAIGWLVSRFRGKQQKQPLPGDVVVGDALQRGLQRARARQSEKRVST